MLHRLARTLTASPGSSGRLRCSPARTTRTSRRSTASSRVKTPRRIAGALVVGDEVSVAGPAPDAHSRDHGGAEAGARAVAGTVTRSD